MPPNDKLNDELMVQFLMFLYFYRPLNSDYIFSGSTNDNMFAFNRERKLSELPSLQAEAITAIEMNPKNSLMVTAVTITLQRLHHIITLIKLNK